MLEAELEAADSLKAANDSHSAAKMIAEEANSVQTDMTEILNNIADLLDETQATPEGVIKVRLPNIIYLYKFDRETVDWPNMSAEMSMINHLQNLI